MFYDTEPLARACGRRAVNQAGAWRVVFHACLKELSTQLMRPKRADCLPGLRESSNEIPRLRMRLKDQYELWSVRV